ncbi:hypothetical protein BGY98DRAFT_1102735 [Russula aff. rugulosa BPL654]|nr:hypothetical protein BGY98DRAFT_1102735 [Russula aff. rugulosa BPL654]
MNPHRDETDTGGISLSRFPNSSFEFRAFTSLEPPDFSSSANSSGEAPCGSSISLLGSKDKITRVVSSMPNVTNSALFGLQPQEERVRVALEKAIRPILGLGHIDPGRFVGVLTTFSESTETWVKYRARTAPMTTTVITPMPNGLCPTRRSLRQRVSSVAPSFDLPPRTKISDDKPNATHVSPPHSQSMPPTENPCPSQRDSETSSWWNAAEKPSHTPTKKEAEKVEKERNRSAFNNPTLLGLLTPPKPSPKGASLSAPISPTPGAQGLPFSLPPSLVPSPFRPDSHNGSPSRSPSRESPPL